MMKQRKCTYAYARRTCVCLGRGFLGFSEIEIENLDREG